MQYHIRLPGMIIKYQLIDLKPVEASKDEDAQGEGQPDERKGSSCKRCDDQDGPRSSMMARAVRKIF